MERAETDLNHDPSVGRRHPIEDLEVVEEGRDLKTLISKRERWAWKKLLTVFWPVHALVEFDWICTHDGAN